MRTSLGTLRLQLTVAHPVVADGFHRSNSFSNPEPLSSIALLEVVSSRKLLALGVHAALRVEELSLDNIFRLMLPDTANALPQKGLVVHSLISDSLIGLSSSLASQWLA
jgi:hypothetical protein